ncbi:hypothetical protein B7494_g7093 [Chlorociboria aeruginascens]|nr:hypothetical protein B7494_g7093 [Chlorociboria aeruginascens]
MGRELQKKKKRSSIPKIKLKPKSKRVNPLGNAIIAENWNQKETLSQNYRRLGLTSRLNSATGGIEKRLSKPESRTSTSSKLAIANAFPTTIIPTEAKVERDPETGKILRVVHATKRANPLDDPLNSDSDGEVEGFGEEFGEEEGVEKNEIVMRLEEQAARGEDKKERKQSSREKEWIERLVEKWGADFTAMSRDRRLNPMQQTEADIRRRVGIWKSKLVTDETSNIEKNRINCATRDRECVYLNEGDHRQKDGLRKEIQLLSQQNKLLGKDNLAWTGLAQTIRKGSDEDVQDIISLILSKEPIGSIARALSSELKVPSAKLASS